MCEIGFYLLELDKMCQNNMKNCYFDIFCMSCFWVVKKVIKKTIALIYTPKWDI